MINISLPLLYKNDLFNNYLIDYIWKNPEKLLAPWNIEYIHGAFPWSLWNGDVNSNYGKAVLYNDMANSINNIKAPHLIDCSNIKLDEIDFYDKHQNIILELENATGSYCEIADLNLYDYIKLKYNYINFVFSNKAELYQDFTEEIILTIINDDDFRFIVLNDINLNINNKDKIMILVGNKCHCTKNQYLDCLEGEQINQYNFSNKTNTICNKLRMDNFYDEIIKLNKIGFNHFKIDTPPAFIDLKRYNLFLIKNLIKSDYVLDCYLDFYGT